MKLFHLGEKSILTAHLEEALEQPRCALCHLADDAEHRYIDVLLHELVNDLGVRERLKKTRGFCHRHTIRLVEIGGYGSHCKLAIIYHDLTKDMAEVIRALDDRQAATIEMNAACPVCASIAQSERIYLEILDERLAHVAMREKYAASIGLCMEHWVRAYNGAKRPVRAYLRDNQAQRLASLSGELGEFVRKSVVKDERFGDERDSWSRALALYAGVVAK